MGQNRKSISPRESQRERRIRMVKVAIVTTSHEDLGSSGKKTGFWFEELAAPFYVFKDKGYDVVVASIKGGDPPGDSGSLLKGKKCTGFSETEEAAVQLTAVVPYTPESKMKDLGGLYEKGGDWGSKVVVDGNLVTGQNPASSTAVALKMVDLLA